MTFKDYGLRCDQPPTVASALRYESPVNLSGANMFFGDCSVGAFTYINPHGSFSDTSFGRFCSVAEWVCTGPGRHPTHLLSTHPLACDPDDVASGLSDFPAYRAIHSKLPFTPSAASDGYAKPPKVTIGNDVWIGTRAVIMRGVTVGDGAVIGAGAIVTKDVLPYAVVGGVPARLIRFRFERPIIDRLLELRWWNYDMSQVSNKVDYGKVEEVIEFMNDRIKAGRLLKFSPRGYELRQNGSSFTIGPSAAKVA